jgi:uncharacterized protein (TIGR03083 family)
MRIEDHLASLEHEGALLIGAAEAAGPDAPVPCCPDWRVRDLVHHTGGVHRWATSFVWDKRTDPRDPPEESFFTSPSDATLGEWFREGHAALVHALRTADPELACWSFLPAPSPLAFWARRQAHETAIHRIDAQQTVGEVTEVPAAFAADGIAELLEGFFARSRGSLVADPPVSLGVRTEDTAQTWTIHIGQDGRRITTGTEPADLVLTGSSEALYLALWNRSDLAAVHAEGDRTVWKLWQDKARIT